MSAIDSDVRLWVFNCVFGAGFVSTSNCYVTQRTLFFQTILIFLFSISTQLPVLIPPFSLIKSWSIQVSIIIVSHILLLISSCLVFLWCVHICLVLFLGISHWRSLVSYRLSWWLNTILDDSIDPSWLNIVWCPVGASWRNYRAVTMT